MRVSCAQWLPPCDTNTMKRAYILYALTASLTGATVFVWSLVAAAAPAGQLTVAFLNVGQGDAVYIESPDGHQALIDGGKGRAVLRELGTLMSPNDHSIDAVIATHPDMDHIGGLPDVFDRYSVGMFLESGVHDDGADSTALHRAVKVEGIPVQYARTGHSLDLGGGAYLTFLFPEGDVSDFEPNTGSIVARLTYGHTSFLLTGDSPQNIERYLVHRYGASLASTVLKLGHHGSDTSSSDEFLGAVAPATAVISAGCNNPYGHPSPSVMERLTALGIPARSTCHDGTVIFTSDGVTVTTVQQ